MSSFVGRARYLEQQFRNLADEVGRSVQAGETERPLELRHEFRAKGGNGAWVLDAYLRFVPDDLCLNLGRDPTVQFERR